MFQANMLKSDKISKWVANAEITPPQSTGAFVSTTSDSIAEGVDTYAKFEKVVDLNWSENAYTTTRVMIGNPLQLQKEWDICLWNDAGDPCMEHGLPKLFRERFPELVATEIPFGQLIFSTRTVGKSGITLESERYISKLMATSEVEAFESLQTLCQSSVDNRRQKIAIPIPPLLSIERTRKLIECVFNSKNIEVYLFVTSGALSNNNVQDKKQTVIIKPNGVGKSYSDTVRNLRRELNTKELGIRVGHVSETKDGDVKMVIYSEKKDSGNILKTAINEKMQHLKVDVEITKKDLVIRDLKEDMTNDDIIDAIQREYKPDIVERDKIVVHTPREDYKGRNRFVSVPEAVALKLLKMRRLEMGWDRCRIEEKVNLTKCYNCLHFGHFASECSEGKNCMAGTCLKCGSKEHLAKDCSNKLKCYVCKEGEHRADSMACPRYKQLFLQLKSERREVWKK